METKIKLKEVGSNENFLIMQFFSNKKYPKNVFGSGYGLKIFRHPDGSGYLRLVHFKNDVCKNIGPKYLISSLSFNKWYKLRLQLQSNEINIFLDNKLIINYSTPFSSLSKLINSNNYFYDGFSLIKYSIKIEVNYFRVFTEESNKIKINNLKPGWLVNIVDKSDNIIHSNDVKTNSVVIELNNIVRGYIRVADSKGILKAETLLTYIIGGDSYTYLSIDIDEWIRESEKKLFSDTLWRENGEIGGIIARLGDPSVFAESTEFIYFYYLHWKYLLDGNQDDFDRIMRIRSLFDKLRENDESKKHYGLFYERIVIERNNILKNKTRNIVQGSIARFLAHYYLLTEDSKTLEYLIILLDKMIEIGIVNPESGELKNYDPSLEKIIENTCNIKNSYIIDGYVLGYSLTHNKIYINAAKKITDWLISKNYDPTCKSFPKTSTHDTMEFLESVWSVYSATGEKKYLTVIKDTLTLYFELQHRGKLIPFRYYNETDEAYSYDTLTPLQLFLAIKVGLWEDIDFTKMNNHFLAYLYYIRNTGYGEKFNEYSLRYYLRYILYKTMRWQTGKEFGEKHHLWNFRYSSISNLEVRDNWAKRGNWMSFSLSYLLHNLYTLKNGPVVSIFPNKYYLGQPYVAFSEAKINKYDVLKNEIIIHFESNKDFNVTMITPLGEKSYKFYVEDTIIDKSKNIIDSNKSDKMIDLKIKKGNRILKVNMIS